MGGLKCYPSAPLHTTGKSALNPLGREYALLEKDLVAVRAALGSLIIVGDQIEYKQRIQVDSRAVNPEIQPSPQIREVGGTLERDHKSQILLLGKNLQKATLNLMDCEDTVIGAKEIDESGAVISLKDVQVMPGCTATSIRMVVNTGGGTPTTVSVPVRLQAAEIKIVGNREVQAAADGSLTLKLSGKYLTGADPIVSITTGPLATATSVAAKGVDVKTESMSVVIAKSALPKADEIPEAGVPITVKVHTSAPTDSDEVTFTLKKKVN